MWRLLFATVKFLLKCKLLNENDQGTTTKRYKFKFDRSIFANVCFVFVHWFTLPFIFIIRWWFMWYRFVTENESERMAGDGRLFSPKICSDCLLYFELWFDDAVAATPRHATLSLRIHFQQNPLISLTNIESISIFIWNAN